MLKVFFIILRFKQNQFSLKLMIHMQTQKTQNQMKVNLYTNMSLTYLQVHCQQYCEASSQCTWDEAPVNYIVNCPLATSCEILVASAKFLVALVTRKAQFQTLHYLNCFKNISRITRCQASKQNKDFPTGMTWHMSGKRENTVHALSI